MQGCPLAMQGRYRGHELHQRRTLQCAILTSENASADLNDDGGNHNYILSGT